MLTPASRIIVTATALMATFMTAPVFAQLEEIVVTAQRREASLQEVPASVTALTGKKLKRTIIIVLVLALGYFLYERQGLVQQAEQVADPLGPDQRGDRAPRDRKQLVLRRLELGFELRARLSAGKGSLARPSIPRPVASS